MKSYSVRLIFGSVEGTFHPISYNGLLLLPHIKQGQLQTWHVALMEVQLKWLNHASLWKCVQAIKLMFRKGLIALKFYNNESIQRADSGYFVIWNKNF